MFLFFASRATTEEFRFPIGKPYDPNALLSIAILLTSTWLIVSLRVYCKCYIMKSFAWDDIFMAVSLVSATPISGTAGL
jgi:hypothetical protein